MAIDVTCPSCHTRFQVSDKFAGKSGPCPKCKNTIREFGLYRRKKLPDGTFSEEPEDRNNHAMDALRYLCMGRFGRLPNVRHTVAR